MLLQGKSCKVTHSKIIIKSAEMGSGDCFPRHGDLGERRRGWRWREAAAAPWGKGCCSPLSPEMGKPDVGGDVRDGAVLGGPRGGGRPHGAGGNAAGRPSGFVCSGRDGGAGRGGTNLPSNRGLCAVPGPFPSKIQREGPRWGCTSSLQSVLAGGAVSTRFIPPDGSDRLGAAAFWGSSSSRRESAVSQRLPRRRQKQPAEEAVPRQPFPPPS